MDTSVLDWSAAAAAGAAVAGGKGWQLGRLAILGVPVPEGFVLSAEASRGRAQGDAVPDPVLAAITQALTARGWLNAPLAVRSSAPQEDSAQRSFAGIHETRLNVIGAQALAEAVRAVWDSAYAPQAVAYRERFNIDTADLAMAVVIMPMLPAVAAGIVFTCDPLGGRDDQIVINAHWGLGEALVGGQADGDTFKLESSPQDDTLRVLERQIGKKARMTQALAEGGTALVDTTAEDAHRAVLDDAQLIALAALARDTACALDFAQPRYDIEWVWDGQRFWIVQARPITTRGRHTYAALQTQPRFWTRGNTREMFPGPLSPIDWTLYRHAANRMLTLTYALVDYPLVPGLDRAALFHGRVYLDVSLMQWEAFDAFGIAPDAINRMLGGTQPEIVVPPVTWSQRLARGGRLVRYLLSAGATRRHAQSDLNRARKEAAQWREGAWPEDAAELAVCLRERFATARRADSLFFLQGSAGGSVSGLVDIIEKQRPAEGHALAAALMAGAEPSVTAQQSYDLMALAQTAATDSEALTWLRSTTRIGTQWAQQLPAHSPFRQQFKAFLERNGHRAIEESYFRHPRWREQPDYLLDLVVGLIGSDAQAVRQRQQTASAQAWQRLPFWLRPVVRAMLKSAVRDSNQREAARSALVAYVEVLRAGLLKLADKLGGQGGAEGLDTPEDIFNLTLDECVRAGNGTLPLRFAAQRARERRQQLAHWAAEQEPDVIAEHGEAPATAIAPSASTGDHWTGTAVGAGTAQGQARLVDNAAAGTALQTGDVLVAPSTDPAWTPLFLKASALVMETGGYLSHGAIVAREFGIPAVVNVPGIRARLKDGETIRVDGNTGTISRVSV
ncbi:pyruvate, water dikinase [Ralstonia insidiosa]|uniref:Pyruvate, water dikinase n=1 Tax=Ralstonia insidiosa TaxID=190721 RepID=A0A192A601_9RALS|nr:PEP/pyruvate-binding domain-containing protein [Ralstonia insidiosa]ANJ75768.1 pyruvate, water dikinase [Ralstonia insidiosa]KAB0469432.1 pyruvate, water dikinase [Ralstonia insidiosa]MBY4910115.1 pyruvate, water dikinase [Ralstonia insidiosa]